jgi:membrane-associated phospholipid phosphatase
MSRHIVRASAAGLFLLLGFGVFKPLDLAVRDLMPPQSTQLIIWISHLGDNLAYAIGIVYFLRLSPRLRLRLALLLAGQHVLVFGTKALFHTLRPPQLGQVGGFAFPSGHTALAVCLYGFMGRTRRAWWLLPPLVALGRVGLGHHWFSDVLGGALLGWLWLDIFLTLAD